MKAFFAGSFDPFTIGHKSVVDRALRLFDGVVVAVGVNRGKPRTPDLEARLDRIRQVFANEPRVEVMVYTGLTAVAAKEAGANVLLRGVRSSKDFEYERDMADANRALEGMETLCLFADPSLAWVSSSLVRELEAFGRPSDSLIP